MSGVVLSRRGEFQMTTSWVNSNDDEVKHTAVKFKKFSVVLVFSSVFQLVSEFNNRYM